VKVDDSEELCRSAGMKRKRREMKSKKGITQKRVGTPRVKKILKVTRPDLDETCIRTHRAHELVGGEPRSDDHDVCEM